MTDSAVRPAVERGPAPDGRSRGALIAVTTLLGFASSAVTFMLTPLLPILQKDFDLTVGQIAWVFTMILLGGGVSTIMLPRLADVLGDRVAATFGAVLLGVGTLIPGTIDTFPALLVGASVMGLGASTGQVGVGTLRRHLHGSSIQTAVTVTQVAQALGAGVGLVAGGVALSHVSMQTFFLSATVVYAIAAAVAWWIIPTGTRDPAATFGIGNLAGLVAWILVLLYGIKTASSDGIGDAKAIGLIVVGLLGGAVWARLETRSAAPVFDLSLLRSGTVARTVLASFTIGMAIQSVTFLIPFYVQMQPAAGYGLGYDALQTGLLLLPYSLLGAVGGIVGGVVAARTRPLLVAGLGATCHALAAIVLITTMSNAASFITAAAIYGVGGGLVGVGLFGSIQQAVPHRLAGMGTSMVGIIMTLSGSLGPAIYSSILQSKSVTGMPGVPAEDRFVICLIVAGTCDVLVAIACYTARRPRTATALEPDPAPAG